MIPTAPDSNAVFEETVSALYSVDPQTAAWAEQNRVVLLPIIEEAIREVYPPEPTEVRIRARYRDWNAKSNGSEVHRRGRFPTGETGWLKDIGSSPQGQWLPRDFRAAARSASQTVLVPVGTIIVDFEKPFRGGAPSGPAVVTVGVVRAEGGKAKFDWGGLKFKQSGCDVVVTLPSKEKVTI